MIKEVSVIVRCLLPYFMSMELAFSKVKAMMKNYEQKDVEIALLAAFATVTLQDWISGLYG